MNITRTITTTAGAIALSLIGIVAFADSSSDSTWKPPLATDSALVKRGEYMVNNVVLCIDCHSPRNNRGEFIPEKHLTGSVLGFAPSVPMPAWAAAAPSIAGMPDGWTEEQTVHFLMSGERPNNLPPPRPPMPPYRLSQADAESVVAYLHSLSSTADNNRSSPPLATR